MTALDVKHAKQALAWRLREWETADPDARAASFIDDLVSKGWQMSPERESRPRPPRAGDACHTCGRVMHGPDVVCDVPTARPLPPSPPTDAYLAARMTTTRRETEPETDQPKEGEHA